LARGPEGDIHAVLLTHRSDIDGDGDVDASDYSILLGDWGCTSDCRSDLDGNGSVGSEDLAIILADLWPADTAAEIDLICAVPGCIGTGVPEEEEAAASAGGPDEDPLVAASLSAGGFSSLAAYASWFRDASWEQRSAMGALIYASIASSN
jgi:hypothetical protein